MANLTGPASPAPVAAEEAAAGAVREIVPGGAGRAPFRQRLTPYLFIVVPVGGRTEPQELVALALPEAAGG